MAYDRYDPRDERPRWRDDRQPDRRHDDDRGFFERAGDEVASWFGDDEADRRRREDQRMEGRDHGRFSGRGDTDRERSGRDPERGYRPASGERSFAGSSSRGNFAPRDSEPERDVDPNYRSWRQRQLDELDRDYAEYRREHQARFEEEFGGWRQRRQQKRGLLGQIREHMEVVGSDDEHVGTVDRTAGDRLILAKSDPDSGGVHHSLSCSDIDRVDGDRVILGCKADEARSRWRDESRSRALFERDDQGEMGDRVLDRSFSGTYR